MAKPRNPYFDYVEELFEPLGPVAIKRMFGGAGVYAGDVMFALIADDQIYLKVDERLKADLESEGSGPFTYDKKDGQQAVMAYYALPDVAADEPGEASAWARRALDVALKSKRAKRAARGHKSK